MKSLTILECMCYMGSTEATGLLSTTGIEDFNDFVYCEFACEGRRTIVDGEIKPDTKYLYSYDDRLLHPKIGEVGADVVVNVENEKGQLLNHIYLYEVE